MSDIVTLDDHRDPLMVVVETNCSDGRTNRYLVDHSDSAVKKWIVRTTVWCVRNDHKLRVRAPSEDELGSMRVFRPELVKRRDAA